MLDSKRIAAFITMKRKERGMTQAEVAERLGVSFQAVSKWENGTIPNVEILVELAKLLHVSTDTLLAGGEEWFSYEKVGIDLEALCDFKEIAASFCGEQHTSAYHPPLLDISFPEMREPVLVMNSNTIGEKCQLAAKYGYNEVIGQDIVNDLATSICCAGAHPLALLDSIVGGSVNEELFSSLLKGMSDACRENECVLAGGCTNVQPQIMQPEQYVLSANIIGVVERSKVLDGTSIRKGDVVLAISSNGLHSCHYTQMRVLLETIPHIKKEKIEGETFIQHIMKPHPAYYKALKPLLGGEGLHGMAHMTVQGLTNGNLRKLIPENLTAELDLHKLHPLPFFSFLKRVLGYNESDMINHHNCGVGLFLIVEPDSAQQIIEQVSRHFDCYELGCIKAGTEKIVTKNHVKW